MENTAQESRETNILIAVHEHVFFLVGQLQIEIVSQREHHVRGFE